MQLVPNLEFIRIDTKLSEFFLMFHSPYTKSGVMLLTPTFYLVLLGWVGQTNLT
jgi:hypothetical protein